uniref:Delta(24)-sterol reductase n=1 Tax=Rhizochromulina marina TaxID=1034831 RepID=A0A7S2WV87_9STRA
MLDLLCRGLGAVFLAVFIISVMAGSSAGKLSKDFPWQFRLAAQFRTPVLMFVVVPLSFLRYVRTQWRLRSRREVLRDSLGKGAEGHKQRVAIIVDQVKQWNDAGRPRPLRTARKNWEAMSTKLSSNKDNCHLVPTGHLNFILDVDTTSETPSITLEPAVSMGEIQDLLNPLGFALEINVEMESITIGGVAMGFGMEVNSHRSGFFQETVLEYELVTSTGEVVVVTAESDPDLFYALPWSCGSLGFLTRLKVKIIPTKKFVHMKYRITRSPAELCRVMTELSEAPDSPFFLEATVYSKNVAVLQMGDFVDSPTDPSKVNGINWWWKPFYFRWLENFIDKDGGEEFIPYSHYTNRFTRSIFWEIEDMIPFSNHPLYRFFWGWMGAPEVSLLKLFQGPVIRRASVYAHAVQESIMPVRCLEEGLDNFDGWYGVYPLLVFPLRVYDRGQRSGFLTPQQKHLAPGKDWGIWVDLGAYGAPRDVKAGRNWDAKRNIRNMEHWTRDNGGWQAFYTDMFCTHHEFRQMFNHAALDKARERLRCVDAFPLPYTKMKPEAGIVDLKEEEEQEKKAGLFVKG